MARIRAVKPEFFDSPSTAACTPWARLLYIAMWCLADDWGVGPANMKELAAFAFPNDEQWTSKELPSLCKEVADNFGAVFYSNRGRPYYAIPAWDDHQITQRRAKRRHPTPDDPDSAPDLRFHSEPGTSVSTQGTSLQTQGNHEYGTGEQGNRGTGEQSLSPDPAPPSQADEKFEEFWDAYGKKVGRKKAEQKWQATLRKPGVTADTLIAAAKSYIAGQRAANKHPEFTKDPLTWLNGEHWNDQPVNNITQLRPSDRKHMSDFTAEEWATLPLPERAAIAARSTTGHLS